ncbi:glyoxysomal fatty acid beta-oxidation multifunctional protein MFP-a isoform X1 [Selaginella moellendorffii]|uniref:glyoxysomal fatty acid beta-oxidation multifunctional protein MFP-a isoform X1 n=1 Tax=Selaginella moellendorffii TaxID=88036 RepID=UPI000D1C22C6|nr:glyoxysomal fatty acid beta-oxidation multifunctional protein MFP-a isoform X1 [Selaginella moellendorffii]|eukprot:XP_024538949.1 glyoxysomal fatty acid beta-oxidation multifunctional protein MFP-a isoform X1 [Selaginella moellendorffii]
MARPGVSLEVGADKVAVITLRNPPVNALAMPVLWGLKEKYEEACSREDVKAIVVTGANGKFSGGFDISTIQDVQASGNMSALGRISVDLMTKLIEEAGKPSVAAIQGLALGGGLELAMCCHARVAAPKAQLGLPELQLGIIPGFGGTQRLPRLVGLTKAIEMMLLSKPVTSEEGKELGLVDELVPAEAVLTTARKVAVDIAEGRRPWCITLHKTDKLEPLGEAREILKFARAQAMKTAPKLTHPHVCLDAIEEGIVKGGFAGLLKEEKAFQEALFSDASKSLTHIFFAQRSTSKVPGVTDVGLKPKVVKKVAVIGGGFMGSGIVTALILSNIKVVLKEVNSDFLQQGLNRVKGNLQSRVKKGKLSKDKFERAISLVEGVLDYEQFGSVDVVIEAVVENVGLKQQIFADLEKFCSPSCVLASNTSTIDLNVVGSKTKAQDRIIGAHFFSPAHVMPLLEVVRTEKTSPQVILDLMTLGKTIKKIPVVVGNCTGFAVNRVFFPYTQAATMLLDLGVDPYRIDRAITGFGMPMGPFRYFFFNSTISSLFMLVVCCCRLADFVGFGVAVAVGQQYLNSFPERVYVSQIFPLMFSDKRLGEGNRKGFYLYDEKRKPRPAPELQGYVDKSRQLAKLMPGGKPINITDKEIVEMILFPVVNEACRVLEEGVVVKASDLDIATVLGMGFPPYKGGLVFWADMIGAGYIASKLKEWSETYGKFFQPSPFLQARASQGGKLSDPVKSGKSRL